MAFTERTEDRLVWEHTSVMGGGNENAVRDVGIFYVVCMGIYALAAIIVRHQLGTSWASAMRMFFYIGGGMTMLFVIVGGITYLITRNNVAREEHLRYTIGGETIEVLRLSDDKVIGRLRLDSVFIAERCKRYGWIEVRSRGNGRGYSSVRVFAAPDEIDTVWETLRARTPEDAHFKENYD
ncbi:MAG: hypothetical protein Q4C53_02985 [Clostridia bacterium]|nr:hypothetical protein [Clostridia bacterium]